MTATSPSASSPVQTALTKLAALQESVDCVICRGRLQRPVVTVCGHTFCGKCVDKTFEAAASTTKGRGKGVSCPLCMTPLHKRSICETERTRSIVYAIQKVADLAKVTLKVSFPSAFVADACVMTSASLTRVGEENDDKNSNEKNNNKNNNHDRLITDKRPNPNVRNDDGEKSNKNEKIHASKTPSEIYSDFSSSSSSSDQAVNRNNHNENLDKKMNDVDDDDDDNADVSVIHLAPSKRPASRRARRQKGEEEEEEVDEEDVVSHFNTRRRRRESALSLARSILPLSDSAASRDERSWLKAVKTGGNIERSTGGDSRRDARRHGRNGDYDDGRGGSGKNHDYARLEFPPNVGRKRKLREEDHAVHISDPSDDENRQGKRTSQIGGQTKGKGDLGASRRTKDIASRLKSDRDREVNKRSLGIIDRTKDSAWNLSPPSRQQREQRRLPSFDDYAFISSCSQSSPETSTIKKKKCVASRRRLQQQQKQKHSIQSRRRGDVAGLQETAQRIKEAYIEKARQRREMRRAATIVSKDAVGVRCAAGESVAEYSGVVGVKGGVELSKRGALSFMDKDRMSKEIFSDGREEVAATTTTEEEEEEGECIERTILIEKGDESRPTRSKSTAPNSRRNALRSTESTVSTSPGTRCGPRTSTTNRASRSSKNRWKESDSDSVSIHSVPSVESLFDKSGEEGFLLSPSQPLWMTIVGSEKANPGEVRRDFLGGGNRDDARSEGKQAASSKGSEPARNAEDDGRTRDVSEENPGDNLPQYLFPVVDSQADKPTQPYHAPETSVVPRVDIPDAAAVTSATRPASTPETVRKSKQVLPSAAARSSTLGAAGAKNPPSPSVAASPSVPKTPSNGGVTFKSCLRLTPASGSTKGVRFQPEVKEDGQVGDFDRSGGAVGKLIRDLDNESSDSDSVLPTPGSESALTRMKAKVKDGGGAMKIRKLSKDRRSSTTATAKLPPNEDLEALRSAVGAVSSATSPARSSIVGSDDGGPVSSAAIPTRSSISGSDAGGACSSATSPARSSIGGDAVSATSPARPSDAISECVAGVSTLARFSDKNEDVLSAIVSHPLAIPAGGGDVPPAEEFQPTIDIGAITDSDDERVVPDTFPRIAEEKPDDTSGDRALDGSTFDQVAPEVQTVLGRTEIKHKSTVPSVFNNSTSSEATRPETNHQASTSASKMTPIVFELGESTSTAKATVTMTTAVSSADAVTNYAVSAKASAVKSEQDLMRATTTKNNVSVNAVADSDVGYSQVGDPITVIVNEGDDFEDEYLTHRFDGHFQESFEEEDDADVFGERGKLATEEKNGKHSPGTPSEHEEEPGRVERMEGGNDSSSAWDVSSATTASMTMVGDVESTSANTQFPTETHLKERTGADEEETESLTATKRKEILSSAETNVREMRSGDEAYSVDEMASLRVDPQNPASTFSSSQEVFTPVSPEDMEALEGVSAETEKRSPIRDSRKGERKCVDGRTSDEGKDTSLLQREVSPKQFGSNEVREMLQSGKVMDDSKPPETMDILDNLSFTPSSRKCFSIDSSDFPKTVSKPTNQGEGSKNSATEQARPSKGGKNANSSVGNDDSMKEFDLCDNSSFQAAVDQMSHERDSKGGVSDAEVSCNSSRKETLDLYDQFDLCSAEVEEMFRPLEQGNLNDDAPCPKGKPNSPSERFEVCSNVELQAMMKPFSQIQANDARSPSEKSQPTTLHGQQPSSRQEFELCSNDFEEPFTQASDGAFNDTFAQVGHWEEDGISSSTVFFARDVVPSDAPSEASGATGSNTGRKEDDGGQDAREGHQSERNVIEADGGNERRPFRSPSETDPFAEDTDDEFFLPSSLAAGVPESTSVAVAIVENHENGDDDDDDDDDVNELPSSLDPNATEGRFRSRRALSKSLKDYDLCSNTTSVGLAATAANDSPSISALDSSSSKRYDLCSNASSKATVSQLGDALTKSPLSKKFEICSNSSSIAPPFHSSHDSKNLPPKARAFQLCSNATGESHFEIDADNAASSPLTRSAKGSLRSPRLNLAESLSGESPSAGRSSSLNAPNNALEIVGDASESGKSPRGETGDVSLGKRRSTSQSRRDVIFASTKMKDWSQVGERQGVPSQQVPRQDVPSYNNSSPSILLQETNLADRIKRGRRNATTVSRGRGGSWKESPSVGASEEICSSDSKTSRSRKVKASLPEVEGAVKNEAGRERQREGKAEMNKEMEAQKMERREVGREGEEEEKAPESPRSRGVRMTEKEADVIEFVNLCSEDERENLDKPNRISTQDLSSTQREERLARNIRIDEQRQMDFEEEQRRRIKTEILSEDELPEDGGEELGRNGDGRMLTTTVEDDLSLRGRANEADSIDLVGNERENKLPLSTVSATSVRLFTSKIITPPASETPIAIIKPITAHMLDTAAFPSIPSSSRNLFNAEEDDDDDDDDDDDESLEYSTAKLREIQHEMAEIRRRLCMDSSAGGDDGTGGGKETDDRVRKRFPPINDANPSATETAKGETRAKFTAAKAENLPGVSITSAATNTPEKASSFAAVEFFTPKSRHRSSLAVREQLLEEFEGKQRLPGSLTTSNRVERSPSRPGARSTTTLTDDLPSTFSPSPPKPMSTLELNEWRERSMEEDPEFGNAVVNCRQLLSSIEGVKKNIFKANYDDDEGERLEKSVPDEAKAGRESLEELHARLGGNRLNPGGNVPDANGDPRDASTQRLSARKALPALSVSPVTPRRRLRRRRIGEDAEDDDGEDDDDSIVIPETPGSEPLRRIDNIFGAQSKSGKEKVRRSLHASYATDNNRVSSSVNNNNNRHKNNRHHGQSESEPRRNHGKDESEPILIEDASLDLIPRQNAASSSVAASTFAEATVARRIDIDDDNFDDLIEDDFEVPVSQTVNQGLNKTKSRKRPLDFSY